MIESTFARASKRRRPRRRGKGHVIYWMLEETGRDHWKAWRAKLLCEALLYYMLLHLIRGLAL